MTSWATYGAIENGLSAFVRSICSTGILRGSIEKCCVNLRCTSRMRERSCADASTRKKNASIVEGRREVQPAAETTASL
eukprot:1297571-Pleurochrysis_carterae.AAC.2